VKLDQSVPPRGEVAYIGVDGRLVDASQTSTSTRRSLKDAVSGGGGLPTVYGDTRGGRRNVAQSGRIRDGILVCKS